MRGLDVESADETFIIVLPCDLGPSISTQNAQCFLLSAILFKNNSFILIEHYEADVKDLYI